MDQVINYVIWMTSTPADWWESVVDISTATAALASVVIAVIALCHTRSQAAATQKHNRLMVRPHLDDMTYTDEASGQLRYEITNNGIGPAIVTAAAIYMDGEQVSAEDPVEMAGQLFLTGMPHLGWGHETVAIGAYISPGQRIELLTINTEPRFPPTEMRKALRARARLTLEYESIYGELFTFDSHRE